MATPSLLQAPASSAKKPIDFSAIKMTPPGQPLPIPGAPVMRDLPGIGTIKITPKAITPAPIADKNAVGDNAAGLYARTGIDAPVLPPAGPAGYAAPTISGLPKYPSGIDTATHIADITKAYKDTLSSITALESQIAGAAVASPEEKALKEQLIAKKAQLDSFDLGSLQSQEALLGQGRGITTGNLSIQDTKLRRTHALERLGLANEAETLTAQLGLAQDDRKAQGDFATTQYNLATKKLDIALGLEDKLKKISDDERDNARQFLLDTVNFSEGKTFEQLDADTQHAISAAVSNSPITLDMLKTALKNGAEKAAAAARGDLRSVAGVGVVLIDPKTGKYKVVVPENPSPSPAPGSNAPTFEKYLADQNLPLPTLTPYTIDKVRQEYDAKYGNPTVNLGKLTPTNKQDLAQANLGGAPTAVQSYFLNAPTEFRDTYQRDIAAGKVKGAPTLEGMISTYTTWYNAQKKTGTRDWAALLKPAAK